MKQEYEGQYWQAVSRCEHKPNTRKGTNRLHRRRVGFDGNDRDAFPGERLRRLPAHEVHQVPGSHQPKTVR